MANTAAKPVTFLPYVGQDKNLQRARDLQLSAVRSHTALQRHARTRKKREASSSEESASSRYSSPSKDDVKAPAGELYQFSTQRLNDWQFGSLGPSCRPVNDFDISAILYVLNRSPEWALGKYFLGRSASVMTVVVRPSELVQRAMSALPLLDCLVASTALLISYEHPTSNGLVVEGHRTLRAALRSVRTSLQRPDDSKSLEMLMAVLLLCIASFMVGETAAARVHLMFLTQATNDLDPSNGQLTKLLYQIRGCDMRYALETGEHPMSSVSWEQTVRPTEESKFVFLLDDVETDATSGALAERTEMNGTSCPPSSMFELPDLDEVSVADSAVRSRMGFRKVIQAELLSKKMQIVVGRYADALDYISELSCAKHIEDYEKISSISVCFACLYWLCTEWATVSPFNAVSVSPSPGKPHAGSSENLSRQESLDWSVLVTLQIHFAFCVGDWLCPSLPILARRLRLCLVSSGLIAPNTTVVKEHSKLEPFETRLLLWIVVMGMLASINDTTELKWYRTEARRLISAVQLYSEDDIVQSLASFTPPDAMAGDIFVTMAKRVVSPMADAFTTYHCSTCHGLKT